MRIELDKVSFEKAQKQLFNLGLYDAYYNLEETVHRELSKKNYKEIEPYINPQHNLNNYYCEVWLRRELVYDDSGEPCKAVYHLLGYQAYKIEHRSIYDHYTHLLVNTFIDYINPDLERIKEL